MSGTICMMSPRRAVPEGGCPHPFEPPAFSGDSRTVQVAGGQVREGEKTLPASLTLGELLSACGADAGTVKAVYLGWPTGRFYPCDPELVLTLDCETVYIMDQGECAVELLAKLAENMRGHACGRCVFGREGTYQFHLFFSDIAAKKGQSTDLERLEELAQAMTTQSACGAGTAAGTSVLTALELFREEIAAHVAKKSCPALRCKAFLQYYIDPTLCTGCHACADACDEEAIDGKKGQIHVLDRTMCEKCGACMEACPAGAIRPASGALPRLPSRPIPRGSWK